MARFCFPVGLLIATLVLPGCASRQQADLSQWRDYRADTEEEPPARTKAASRSREAPGAKSAASSEVMETVGTVGRTTATIDGPRHLRPFPARGTPEHEQLRAEEIEQEERVNRAVNGICRGC